MYLSRATGLSQRPHKNILSNSIEVWHIRITLHFLSDSGNMLDCACLAAMTALKHFRRPDIEVIGDEVIVVRTSTDIN